MPETVSKSALSRQFPIRARLPLDFAHKLLVVQETAVGAAKILGVPCTGLELYPCMEAGKAGIVEGRLVVGMASYCQPSLGHVKSSGVAWFVCYEFCSHFATVSINS